MSRNRPDPNRLIDEMTLALMDMRSLDDEAACILQLMQKGWRAAVIMKYLDEALELARLARADGWQETAEARA